MGLTKSPLRHGYDSACILLVVVVRSYPSQPCSSSPPTALGPGFAAGTTDGPVLGLGLSKKFSSIAIGRQKMREGRAVWDCCLMLVFGCGNLWLRKYPTTSSWNASLVRDSFVPFEADQILRIPLPSSHHEDTFCCGKMKNGVYTVKTGYHFALQQLQAELVGNSSQTSFPDYYWQKLWKLPLKQNLIRRGIQCEPYCIWCKVETETECHLFRECTWEQNAWEISSIGNSIQLNSQSSFSQWVNDIIGTALEETICLFTALCYQFWFARNKMIFENKCIAVEQLILKANESVARSQRATIPTATQSLEVSTQQNNWLAPPPGKYKVNCDAVVVEEGNWGIGIIIRDCEGIVLAAATRRIETLPDASIAEAFGIKFALQLAWELSFMDIIVESDCKEAIDQISSLSTSASYLSMITAYCRTMSSNFTSCNFRHSENRKHLCRLLKSRLYMD
ncbi:Ribonuclease H-like superfamily [Sesbania bispinosa]|nr:Ribonuclease H-like superfamily [Sesbania bispinosa]